MLLGQRGQLVEDFRPHGDAGDGAELVGGDFDGEVERATLAYLDDGGGLALAGWQLWFPTHADDGTVVMSGAPGIVANQEVGDEFDWVLRGGEADALGRLVHAGEHGAGREWVLAAHESVEALE